MYRVNQARTYTGTGRVSKVDFAYIKTSWKAVGPGPFAMGSEAYWKSSMVANDNLPPMPGHKSSKTMISAKMSSPGLMVQCCVGCNFLSVVWARWNKQGALFRPLCCTRP